MLISSCYKGPFHWITVAKTDNCFLWFPFWFSHSMTSLYVAVINFSFHLFSRTSTLFLILPLNTPLFPKMCTSNISKILNHSCYYAILQCCYYIKTNQWTGFPYNGSTGLNSVEELQETNILQIIFQQFNFSLKHWALNYL